jgi:hypothetical protein
MRLLHSVMSRLAKAPRFAGFPIQEVQMFGRSLSIFQEWVKEKGLKPSGTGMCARGRGKGTCDSARAKYPKSNLPATRLTGSIRRKLGSWRKVERARRGP